MGGVIIIGISIWGALLSYKHFERHRRHLHIAQCFVEALENGEKQQSAKEIEKCCKS